MNKKILAISSATVLLIGTGLIFTANASAFGHHPTDRHPNLTRALRALESAEADLNRAPHEFDGHRAAAARLAQEAISQTRAALALHRR